MIKIFSIKEIIQASTDILNSQNLEKTTTKNTNDSKKKQYQILIMKILLMKKCYLANL